MKCSIVIVLLCMTLASTLSHAQGGAGTHGGDTINPSLIAGWFYDEKRVIHVCTDSHPDFGVSGGEVRQIISRAFRTWQSYFLERSRIYAVGRPSFNLEFLDRCDGREDLRFYLGTTSKEVEAEKKYYRAPYAFSRRTAYDARAYWGKGFVWIGNPEKGFPNWKSPGHLDAFIRHEIGHVLGCDHTEGTIMDRDIALLLRTYTKDLHGEEVLTWIDLLRQLLLSKKQVYSFKPFGPGGPGHEHFYERPLKTIRFILGKEWKYDKETAITELHFDSEKGGRSYLELRDKTSRLTLNLEWGFSMVSTTGNEAFRYLGSSQSANGEPASTGQTLYGQMTLPNGKRCPVLLFRNHATWYPNFPAELFILRSGKAERVFPPMPM